MLRFRQKGNFRKTENFLNRMAKEDYLKILNRYGIAGVDVLRTATPKDSGKTAASWGYEIEETSTGVKLVFTNSNINNGVNIAIILQYGHGTGTGGYVQGRDYINPAIRPIFDSIAEEAWREVRS